MRALILAVPLFVALVAGCTIYTQGAPPIPETHAQPLYCSGQSDCPAGTECQGPAGCGFTWTCGPIRHCTQDMVQFCGCDGQTFQGSSTCPRRPYVGVGPCEAPPVQTAPASCTSSEQCPEGTECQGPEGCGFGWTCGPRRLCRRDRVPYCGCDGNTFVSNGGCPSRPYLHRGECEQRPPPPPGPPAPIACTSNAQCPGGAECQGPQGCGMPWTCGPRRQCTADVATFCGCDGKEFGASSSCPGRPYSHRGPCSFKPPPQPPPAAACTSNADCPEGTECQGPEGCGLAWTCGAKRRCTRDLVSFCGCDEKTFRASSTCPDRPYSHRGPCSIKPPPPAKPPVACSSNAQCPEGTECQGPAGCGLAWTCGPKRMCTQDLVSYCGCDGETFQASSGCPSRPYAHRGPCSIKPPEKPLQPSACASDAQCPDGLQCQGPEGCSLAWVCGPQRACKKDLVPYCACDGKTFRASSNCPHRPYKHRGPCRGTEE